MTPSGDQLNEAPPTGPVEAIKGFCQDTPGADFREPEARRFQSTRRHPRKRFSAVVDYSSQGHAYRDFIKDISPGGVFIETAISLSIGQELSLTFALPSYRKHIKITGEIVWTGPQGIGVKFKAPKGGQGAADRRKLGDRRRHRRSQLQVATFALLHQPVSLMGEIIDVSMGGLSFRCNADVEIPKGSWTLDLTCPDSGLYLAKLPFTTVNELTLSKEMKRYDVQFGRLTKRQASVLRLFIQAYSPAEA